MLSSPLLDPTQDTDDDGTRSASAIETVVAALVLIAVAMLLGTTLAGCDAQDSLLGEFEGRVEVDGSSRSVEGEAVYTVVETSRGPRFVVGLFVGDLFDSDYDEYDFVSLRRNGARPGVGGYSVTTEGTGARAFTASYARVEDADDPEDASGPILRATDGVVTVTRVDDYGFIAGTFRFDGDGVRVENPDETVTGSASGTFEARYETPETLRALGVDLGLDD